MTTMASRPATNDWMVLLSRLLLSARLDSEANSSFLDQAAWSLRRMNEDQFAEFASLANLNHVVVRALNVVLEVLRPGAESALAELAESALKAEQTRVRNALGFLHEICAAFEDVGHGVAVIKSLDHWPDLGSDLDLYTNARPDDVLELMKRRFGAKIAPRSWGDRLARKWNFVIPGLPEAVEIHIGRLGQTGEQVTIASQLTRRTRTTSIGGYQFTVPSVSDRIMISTLQRMYRHFYFRLCDIIDNAGLADDGSINYEELRAWAIDAGIWEGVATYLVILSDYVKKYRDSGIGLPEFVLDAARFGGSEIFFNKDFLRVPILPQSAILYGTQLAGLMRKRELYSSARLTLLPCLATAAVVGQKITGSDKGIW